MFCGYLLLTFVTELKCLNSEEIKSDSTENKDDPCIENRWVTQTSRGLMTSLQREVELFVPFAAITWRWRHRTERWHLRARQRRFWRHWSVVTSCMSLSGRRWTIGRRAGRNVSVSNHIEGLRVNSWRNVCFFLVFFSNRRGGGSRAGVAFCGSAEGLDWRLPVGSHHTPWVAQVLSTPYYFNQYIFPPFRVVQLIQQLLLYLTFRLATLYLVYCSIVHLVA